MAVAAEALTPNTSSEWALPIGVRVVWERDWALAYVTTQF